MVKNILPLASEKLMRNRTRRTNSSAAALPLDRTNLSPPSDDSLPRIAMISIHGYVAAQPPLGAADTGGQVVYVLELSKKLAQLGYQVDIWTRLFAGQVAIEHVAPRVRILRIPCGGPDFLPKEYLCDHLAEWNENALHFINEHRLEYSFINSHYWDAGLAAQHWSAVLRITHIHTPHSLGWWKKKQMETDAPQSASDFERRYNFERRIAAERGIYASSDTVVATTPSQKTLIVSEYGIAEDKICMIPAGYDDNRFFAIGESARVATRNRLGFSGKVIMALGRLARNKGYDLLIDAFPVVALRDPEAVLYLAIGGKEMNDNERTILAELKELASKSGYRDRIRFGSFIEHSDLPDYYRAADLFVLSSRYEPFGMTAIEAMSSGLPTVVTTHGGLQSALSFGRHAVFADPFDRVDLGITMHQVLSHPRLRARLSRMGAHLARSLFTWTGVSHQLVAMAECRPTPLLMATGSE